MKKLIEELNIYREQVHKIEPIYTNNSANILTTNRLKLVYRIVDSFAKHDLHAYIHRMYDFEKQRFDIIINNDTIVHIHKAIRKKILRFIEVFYKHPNVKLSELYQYCAKTKLNDDHYAVYKYIVNSVDSVEKNQHTDNILNILEILKLRG